MYVISASNVYSVGRRVLCEVWRMDHHDGVEIGIVIEVGFEFAGSKNCVML